MADEAAIETYADDGAGSGFSARDAAAEVSARRTKPADVVEVTFLDARSAPNSLPPSEAGTALEKYRAEQGAADDGPSDEIKNREEDPRYQKAMEWINKNYTLDANPGMPKELADRGLYYYYHTMSKTLDVMGVSEVTDAAGVKHDWKADLLAALAKRQKADGSWVNSNDRWMEGDANLVTGYALMALSHCRPKK